MNQDLLHYIRRYIDFSDEEYLLFQSYLKHKEYAKKEFILEEGNLCKSRYYITEGLVRLYFFNKKENEQILHFGLKNWWITDYDSLIHQEPSRYYIQALEHTSVLQLSNESFEEICLKMPKVERLFRIIMERTYIAAQRRYEFITNMSGEEYYKTFVKQNPQFANRVPQYMIASYLGMTPEFVSKVRAKK